MNSCADFLQRKLTERCAAHEALSAEAKAKVSEVWKIMNSEDEWAGGDYTEPSAADDEAKEVERIKVLMNENLPGVHANMIALAYGETLLNCGVRHGLAMTRVLLDAGADPNDTNFMDGATPLDTLIEIAEDKIEEFPYAEQRMLLEERGGKRGELSFLL